MKKIIFIPGIMGTSLHEGKELKGKKNTRWFSPKDHNLLRLKLENNEPGDITAGAPLKIGISYIGNFYYKNVIYKKIMSNLEKMNSIEFKFLAYGYDWRRDLFDLYEDFKGFIELHCEPTDELIIVAHSMGGLLAHTFCQRAYEKKELPNISKVITLGTPWRGSAKSFITLMYGMDKMCFPSKEIISEVSKTFPSVYQLLPHSSYSMNKGFIYAKDGRKLLWQDMMDYIQGTEGVPYDNVRLFNQKLSNSLNNPWPNNIQHYNFIGYGQGTIEEIYLEQYNMMPCDGDETVALKSAKPLPNFDSSRIFYTKATHEGLVRSNAVLKAIKEIIISGNVSQRGITTSYIEKTDWVMQKIACPVEVFVENEEELLDLPEGGITKHSIGDATFIIYNENVSNKVFVEPYDKGLTSIETVIIQNNSIQTIEKFPSIEVDPATRTIIETDISQEKNVKTNVYVSDQYEDVPLKGVLVEVPEHRRIFTPKTTCKIEPRGQKEDGHLDWQGAILKFNAEVEKPSKILETRYRINESEWHISYNQDIKLVPNNKEIKYGKNVLEYYSIDIYENIERVKKSEFIIEFPTPESKLNVIMQPDRKPEIRLEPIDSDIFKYKYEYLLNNNKTIEKYEGNIQLGNSTQHEINYRAENIFGVKSKWTKVRLNLEKLQDKVWDISGFNGNIKDLVECLPHSQEEFVECLIGDKKKELGDKVRKNSKKVILKFDDVTYEINLVPSLEIYLDYHSEIIRKSEKNIKISFIIQDGEGISERDLSPQVKYTLWPVKDVDRDVIYPSVSNKNGKYSFNLPLKYLSNDVEKIKIEFRDHSARVKPIATRDFKVEN